jgi:hypothetical protein
MTYRHASGVRPRINRRTVCAFWAVIQPIKSNSRASVSAKRLALISKNCPERFKVNPFRQEPSPITRLPGPA